MASTEQASSYVHTWLRKWTGGIDQRHSLCCLLPSQVPCTKASTPRANTYGRSVTREGCCCQRGVGGSFSWRSLTAVDMKVKETLPPPTPSCSISRGFYSPHAVSCVSRRIDVQFVALLPTCRYSRSVIFFGLSMIDEMLKNGRPYFPDSQWGLLFSCSLLTQTLKPLNGLSIDLQEK